MQDVYINLDDSGKLSNKESISVYGGIVFLSKMEKDKFITQYRSIINDIKCKYCTQNICVKNCPEIKNTNVKKSDKRRLMNYIKKYFIVALVIKNDDVYYHIKESKAAKGRFIDYSIRRLIKEIIKFLIKTKKINPKYPIRLIINLDEQTTKSNGYYNLKDGIVEELKYGISNYNYASVINPIVYSDLEVILSYQDSHKSYVVQAADFLAGDIRQISLDNNSSLLYLVDYALIIP